MSGTEAEVIRDLAFQTAEPTVITAGNHYVWITRAGDGAPELIKLDLTDTPPARKTGTVRVADVASFAAYYAKHADPESEVFADLDKATITAVLDAHMEDPEGARWQQHRLILTMQLTEPWKTWTESNRQFMAQQVFAEFLEDNYADVDPRGPIKAADLLEAAQTFEATQKVEFGQGTRLRSGDISIRRIETTAQNGTKGHIQFPEEMDLAIRPYTDCDSDSSIAARLRYRIEGGALKLGYFLNQPERVRREAVEAVTAKAAEAISAVIMQGQPG